MKVPISIMPFIILSCTSRPKSNITELVLSNQNLSAIPDSVFSLMNLEYLQLGNSFAMYPPLSALGADKGTGANLNKLNNLPNDIEKLRQLRVLGLGFTNLRSLPNEIIKLEKLDTLDLSFNKNFNIATTFGTLKEMPWLRYLNIVATNADATTIDKLRKALPETKIDAKLDDLEIDSAETFE